MKTLFQSFQETINKYYKWAIGIIGGITTIIGFIAFVRANIQLVGVIVIVGLFLVLELICIQVGTAKKVSVIDSSREIFVYEERFRNIALLGAVIIPVIFVLLLMSDTSHKFVKGAFVGTPTSTSTSTFTPTPIETLIPSPSVAVPPTTTITPTPTATNSYTPTPTDSITPSSTSTYTPTFTPTPTKIGGGTGHIAYEADVDGNSEIYLLDIFTSGAVPINLTNNFAGDYAPSWSPDGEKLAFVSYRDGNPEIYVMNADGSGLINLTKSAARDFEPSWSPNKEKIVFATYRYSGNRDIAIMNVDGSDVRQLTSNSGYDGSPAFIDNDTVVFASSRDDENPRLCDPCNYEIYAMDVNGENIMRLTDRSSFESYPRVSPDGKYIVFHSTFYGAYNIFTIDVDGYNFNMITSRSARDWYPNWSPDGKWIVFVSDKSGEPAIYIMRINGSDEMPIITLPEVYNPVWRP